MATEGGVDGRRVHLQRHHIIWCLADVKLRRASNHLRRQKVESGVDVGIHLSRRSSEQLEVAVERRVAGIHAYVNEYHSGVDIVRGSAVAPSRRVQLRASPVQATRKFGKYMTGMHARQIVARLRLIQV